MIGTIKSRAGSCKGDLGNVVLSFPAMQGMEAYQMARAVSQSTGFQLTQWGWSAGSDGEGGELDRTTP